MAKIGFDGHGSDPVGERKIKAEGLRSGCPEKGALPCLNAGPRNGKRDAPDRFGPFALLRERTQSGAQRNIRHENLFVRTGHAGGDQKLSESSAGDMWMGAAR